jgi:hypothetical protein
MSAPVVSTTRATHYIQANTVIREGPGPIVTNISVPNNSRVTHRTHPHTQVSAENANNIRFVVNNRLLVNNNLMANNIQAQNYQNKFSLLNTYEYQVKSNNSSVESECTICLEEYKHKSMVTHLACMHKFHTSCIMTWLKVSFFVKLTNRDVFFPFFLLLLIF